MPIRESSSSKPVRTQTKPSGTYPTRSGYEVGRHGRAVIGRDAIIAQVSGLVSLVFVLNYTYSVCMALMQIRDVPDEVRSVLKARAARRGESLNSYLLGLLRREAARPTVDEVLERAAQRSERASVSALTAVSEARAERTTARGRGR